MVAKLEDYIKVYDGAVDSPFCKNIIRTFDSDLSNQTIIDREKRPSFTELNISKPYLEGDLKWNDIQRHIQNVFIDYTELYMKELELGKDFPPKYTFEQYRIKKYNIKHDEFRDHVDVQDYNSARRFLVCFLYLNDIRSGGETEFPKLGVSIKPKCGRILIFPSNWMYRHAGRPVTEKPKYILGSYLHYL